MPNVVITGGSGLIGTALSELLLKRGHEVVILGRKLPEPDKKPITPGLRYALWDVEKQTIDADTIRNADYIIHLAGAGVADKRWTAKRKKEIEESRTHSGKFLVKVLQDIPNQVKAVVSASAIGWYGADPANASGKPFVETDNPSTDFLGETCRLWEASLQPITTMGKRLVCLRTGIVLSSKGGALAEFRKPVKFGVAAILGNGKQVVSWIHIDDMCRMYADAMERDNIQGVFNAVAPNPVTNKRLTLELAKKMKGRFFLPIYVPSFLLKLVLGELSIEVLKSATVSAVKIRDAGFQFLYPALESALNTLVDKNSI